jgi:hypothetical protein
MGAVIQIKGRDAIPVRALPWLADWWFGAQEVAEALGQDRENYPDFLNVRAYRFSGDTVEAVSGREWRNTVTHSIECVIDKNLSHDLWRFEATAALPAGVFVWRDQWEPAYNLSSDGINRAFAIEGDDDCDEDEEDRALNFSPIITTDLAQLVTEGMPPIATAMSAAEPGEIKGAKPTRDSTDKPWLVADLKDPKPTYDWYVPARYFARRLIRNDCTLLQKRQVLATKVAALLSSHGHYKRGGVHSHSSASVLKSFSNTALA